MDSSFQEKSLWVMFVSLFGAFGMYFASVLPNRQANVSAEQVIFFVVVLVFLVVIQIIGHGLVAILDRRATTDERDRLIALKGHRNGDLVLATGVFCALVTALVTQGNFAFTHVLLGFWVVAQLVDIGSQLWLYRRGV